MFGHGWLVGFFYYYCWMDSQFDVWMLLVDVFIWMDDFWNYFGNCIEFKVTFMNTISVPSLSHCAYSYTSLYVNDNVEIEILFANSHIYELIFNFSYVVVFL